MPIHPRLRRRLEQLSELAEKDGTTVALLPEVWAVAPIAVLLLVALALLTLRLA